LGRCNSTAWLLTLTGDPAGAVHGQSAADSVANGINAGLWPPWLPRRERLLADAQERLGEKTYDEAQSIEQEWTFEQAAADAATRLIPYLHGLERPWGPPTACCVIVGSAAAAVGCDCLDAYWTFTGAEVR